MSRSRRDRELDFPETVRPRTRRDDSCDCHSRPSGPVALAGLTVEAATERLASDVRLLEFRRPIIRLPLRPIGTEALQPFGYDLFAGMPSTFAPAYEMNEHFRTAPFAKNLPVLMGLIGIWNRNFLGTDSLAVLPYDQRLHRFPAYLQQLEMESLGKRTTFAGAAVSDPSGPVIWASRARMRSAPSSSCCIREPRTARSISSRR